MPLALRLDNHNIRMIRQMPELRGKKHFARGMFSAIFDGSRPDTVYKLTIDSIGYWLLNCCAMGVSGKHFPKVIKNHRDVGLVRVGREDFPVYLYEIERLNKLQPGSAAKLEAKTIVEIAQRSMSVADVKRRVTQSPGVSKSVRNAIGKVESFSQGYPSAMLDMSQANFMERDNGDLVITDPLFDGEVHKAYYKSNRGRHAYC